MRGLIFELVFAVVITLLVASFMPRPLTWLGITQIALTMAVGLAFVITMQIAWWLHSMAYADPIRQLWQPRLSVVSNFVWFGSLLVYAVFTFYHLVVWSRPHPR